MNYIYIVIVEKKNLQIAFFYTNYWLIKYDKNEKIIFKYIIFNFFALRILIMLFKWREELMKQ